MLVYSRDSKKFFEELCYRMTTRKSELLVNGLIREYCKTYQLDIPDEIITLFFIWYHIKSEILKWSETFHYQSKFSSAIDLSQDNTVVRVDSWGPAYILADVEPVTKGIHCWRIEVMLS